jgi:hypothetical protein
MCVCLFDTHIFSTYYQVTEHNLRNFLSKGFSLFLNTGPRLSGCKFVNNMQFFFAFSTYAAEVTAVWRRQLRGGDDDLSEICEHKTPRFLPVRY